MKEYRLCHKEHGHEHTTALTFRDWGGRQNWQGNASDEEREEKVLHRLAECKKYNRIFYGIKESDSWVEVREVGPWKELAVGGVVPESIRTEEEGSIRPAPKVSVTFEGQELTFDAAESKKFQQLASAYFRRLAGLKPGVDE